MSKIREILYEMLNNPSNNPDDIAKEIEGTFEDILFQLESISEMQAINFNVRKKVRKELTVLRNLSVEITKDIKGNK